MKRCARCDQEAYSRWTVCADRSRSGKKRTRWLCRHCDVGLNELAMRFVYTEDDDKSEQRLARYRRKLLR